MFHDLMLKTLINNLFVIGTGATQAVWTSPNGVTWTKRNLPTYVGAQYSVSYGAGIFVSVSSNSEITTSPDGITWTLRTSAADNNWCAVCYGSGLFVAVSNSGTGSPE